ncbi:MAG TPA: S41 family peptidase, partial [Anaerolineales bacterium]
MAKRIHLILVILLLASLSCQAAGRVLQPRPTATASPPVTVTAAPTITPTGTPTPAPTDTPTPTASPTPEPSATPNPLPSPTVFATPSALQLQVFEEIWQTVKTEYLYRDFNGLDWDAIHLEYRKRIEAGLIPDDFYAAMTEMIDRLGDHHSSYLSPAEVSTANNESSGDIRYVGIGVVSASVPERKLITIMLVYAGSPAEKAGLQIHDNILEVDGQPILDENGNRRSLSGPEGSQLTLTVQTPGQQSRQVTLTRQQVDASSPVPYSLLASPTGKRVGYILVPNFFDNTVTDKLGRALNALATNGPLDGLILDNRQNGGGSITIFDPSLAFFVSGTVGHYVHRQDMQSVNIAGNNVSGSQKVPLVVLVGKDTHSYGEIFSGVLQDLGRAYLIGETTDGNVEILNTYDFKDGSELWLAFETFQPIKHPNANWKNTGIIPDL